MRSEECGIITPDTFQHSPHPQSSPGRDGLDTLAGSLGGDFNIGVLRSDISIREPASYQSQFADILELSRRSCELSVLLL